MLAGSGIQPMIRSQSSLACGRIAIPSAPAAAISAVVHETSLNQRGLGFTPSSTTELHSTSATASITRSASAVVSTYVLLSDEWLLMMKLRITSPARAGRKLFPRYPAMVAENTVPTLNRASAFSSTRQRSDRRKNDPHVVSAHAVR